MLSNKERHNTTKLDNKNIAFVTNAVQQLKINQRRILIDSLEIGIPAPEQMIALGERQLPNGVKVGQLFNSKTLNYKKLTPHRDGLFCERIFGPVQSFVCACGKKKESVQNKSRQKDVVKTKLLPCPSEASGNEVRCQIRDLAKTGAGEVETTSSFQKEALFCPKCQVEYISKNVRRHRLGYIKLFAPVTHIWYLKGRPSYLSLFLGKRKKAMTSLAYCNAYLVEQVHPNLEKKNVLKDGQPVNDLLVFESTTKLKQSREKLPSTLTKKNNVKIWRNLDYLAKLEERLVMPNLQLKKNHGFCQSSNRSKQEKKNKRVQIISERSGVLRNKRDQLVQSKVHSFNDVTTKTTLKNFGAQSFFYLLEQLFHRSKASYLCQIEDFATPQMVPICNEQNPNKFLTFTKSKILQRTSFLTKKELFCTPCKWESFAQSRIEATNYLCETTLDEEQALNKPRNLTKSANKFFLSPYIRAQTSPFLPSLICSFQLRDSLISFLQSSPYTEDIPIPLYCQTERRYPLRDVHKFLTELRSTKPINQVERLTNESIKKFIGLSKQTKRATPYSETLPDMSHELFLEAQLAFAKLNIWQRVQKSSFFLRPLQMGTFCNELCSLQNRKGIGKKLRFNNEVRCKIEDFAKVRSFASTMHDIVVHKLGHNLLCKNKIDVFQYKVSTKKDKINDKSISLASAYFLPTLKKKLYFFLDTENLFAYSRKANIGTKKHEGDTFIKVKVSALSVNVKVANHISVNSNRKHSFFFERTNSSQTLIKNKKNKSGKSKNEQSQQCLTKKRSFLYNEASYRNEVRAKRLTKQSLYFLMATQLLTGKGRLSLEETLLKSFIDRLPCSSLNKNKVFVTPLSNRRFGNEGGFDKKIYPDNEVRCQIEDLAKVRSFASGFVANGSHLQRSILLDVPKKALSVFEHWAHQNKASKQKKSLVPLKILYQLPSLRQKDCSTFTRVVEMKFRNTALPCRSDVSFWNKVVTLERSCLTKKRSFLYSKAPYLCQVKDLATNFVCCKWKLFAKGSKKLCFDKQSFVQALSNNKLNITMFPSTSNNLCNKDVLSSSIDTYQNRLLHLVFGTFSQNIGLNQSIESFGKVNFKQSIPVANFVNKKSSKEKLKLIAQLNSNKDRGVFQYKKIHFQIYSSNLWPLPNRGFGNELRYRSEASDLCQIEDLATNFVRKDINPKPRFDNTLIQRTNTKQKDVTFSSSSDWSSGSSARRNFVPIRSFASTGSNGLFTVSFSINLPSFICGSKQNKVYLITQKEKKIEWAVEGKTKLKQSLGNEVFPSLVTDLSLKSNFVPAEKEIGVDKLEPSSLQNRRFGKGKKLGFDKKSSLRSTVFVSSSLPDSDGSYSLIKRFKISESFNPLAEHCFLLQACLPLSQGLTNKNNVKANPEQKYLTPAREDIEDVSCSAFTQTISKWHINGAKEILSYTGGGALESLLKRFNISLFYQFLFGEIQILRKYYKDQIVIEYNKNQLGSPLATNQRSKELNQSQYLRNQVDSTSSFSGFELNTNMLSRDHFMPLSNRRFGNEQSFGRKLRFVKTLKAEIPRVAPERLKYVVTDKSANLFCRRIYRTTRRLKIVQLLMRSKRRPEWMMISILPVLPPDLRPVLQMGENLIVASDLNTLYQRVIYRNNRHYKGRFLDFHFVSSIHRLVQDAVDRLIENGKGGSTPFLTPGGRPLKSLSDILKGKRGRFRFNLLGKRVDFSGRSVIVVSPNLKIHECGLPREMALELYKYLLIRQLLLQKRVSSIVNAKKLIKDRKPFIWDMLREIIYYHPLLLNRAPTLHRLGIQAFQPKLTLGNAILLHPLVCAGFNADFDGDQMGVHLPLSPQARAEAWDLLWSRNNLLSPATGQPILLPSQDMVLGFYYMTALLPYGTTFRFKSSRRNQVRSQIEDLAKGRKIVSTNLLSAKQKEQSVHVFSDTFQVVHAYQNKQIDIHAPIWLKRVGQSENGEKSQIPVELRIDMFGYQTGIYPTYQFQSKIYKNRHTSFLIFSQNKNVIEDIRTTVGRVLVNNLISQNN